ncbi:nuclease SbcCD subunit C [Kitasatospora herbaricolor]|uniref:AAA family ATPase n=1 Tax=Kitasatospora herbaricolor TaxID=68217 RepID=UPI00174B498B|nr:SMC family ATPase [Kitasatospora herbaricolor]MDQ0311677.1 exonuclease SbcC [Kitasatospora herbaricolor]GGU95942.1 nuclease SbcCD subunit C [Kitasatospora herbaricolor]
MRLHQLTVTAFGPFAGTERVDFDALSSGGLFLLRGATGAGKSSVLDAVCFALYGEVPGARTANRLRSDHADPNRLTEVRLELTLGGRRLEIVRLPEQLRPKKTKAGGLTKERAQTLLREWVADTGDGTPGWRAGSKSHQETGEEIHRLVGMSREQFCQVVLLPQGDFARFLRADAAQRAELLGRLFDTRRFGQVESWLADRRRAQEAAVQAGRRGLRDLVSKAEQAAGPAAEPAADWVPAEDEAPGTSADLTAGVLAWAAILRSGAAEQLAVAESALAGARERHQEAQHRQAAAGELAEHQRRHREAVLQAARLTEQEAALAGERDRLAAAQAAVGVEAVLRLRDAAVRAYEDARREEHRHRENLGRFPAGQGRGDRDDPAGVPDSGPLLARAETEELAHAELRLRAEVVRLEAAGVQERRCAELVREETALEDERRRAEELAEDAAEWLAGFEGRFAALQEEQSAARAAAAEVEQVDARRAEVTGRLAAARRRDGLREEIGRAEEQRLDLHGRFLDAREHGQDVRERRLAGMAAELAAQLRAGEACRVCGSPGHPAPARPAGGQVRPEDEERARAAQAEAERRLAVADQSLTALRVQEAAAAGAAGEESAAELDGALAALAEEHRVALRAADALGAVTGRIEGLTRQQAEQASRLREAGERSAVRTARLEAVRTERQELARQVAAARGEAASVAERAAALAGLARSVSALLAAARTGAQAAARLKEAEEELAGAAAAAGFPSAREAAAVLLPAAERAALQQRLERHHSELSAAQRLLAAPELVAAAALPPADPAGARAAAQAATDRLARATAAQHAARERCADLARIGRRLAELAASLAPVLDGYARISRLAALAAGTSGENRLRMRLESYVLAARLEQVAAAASDRLVRMSGGRYTLVHSDDRTSGGKRSGLSLRVVDAWTGTERDTATLSGGESFFASLALALGLADVVTDEAGGMPLDTLFIDEGFGTLDEQALEEVMDVLDGLRERDRAVGIVSHVADLRARIPAQLLVRKNRHGSTLSLVGREDA